MVFSEVMQEVAERVEGCIGLVVMGMDGIPIEKVVVDSSHSFELLATECTTLLRGARQTSDDVGAGALREIVLMTDALIVIGVAITEDYILLCAMRQGGNHGRARFYMKRASLRLEKEFV